MRVLHLTTEFPPVIYGGLGTAVGGWVHALTRGGLSVAVLLVEGALVVEGSGGAYGGPHPRARAGPTVDREGVAFFRAIWADAPDVGVRLVQEWQPDVVHLHTAMLWPVAEAIQQRTSKPLIYHVHSVDRAEYLLGEEPNQWLAHSEQEAAIAAADRLIALSQSERELLVAYYPHTRARVRIVGNGIDDSAFARAAADRERAPEVPLVLYSGRLVERKGIRELLTAIPQILDRAPDTRFVFAGGPPPLTGDQVAAQWLPPELLALRDRIHFTGWLSPRDVARWYAAADVQVVPSRYEPFGMVILEGMLHGLAIVAADVGGPAEILENERTGLLFPARDAGALAGRVTRLVREPDLRRRIGAAAAREVRSRWTWPHLVRRMAAIYREATSRPHPAWSY